MLHALERVDADFRSALLDEHPVIKTIYEEGAVLRGENVGSAASERVTLSLNSFAYHSSSQSGGMQESLLISG